MGKGMGKGKGMSWMIPVSWESRDRRSPYETVFSPGAGRGTVCCVPGNRSGIGLAGDRPD